MSSPRHPDRMAFQAFARAHIRPSALARDEAAVFDRALWQRLGDHGLFQTVLSADVAAAAAALAGLAHGGLDVPLGLAAAAQWIGGRLLAELGSAAQQARYLDRLVRGEWIVAVCNSEHQAGTQLRGMRSRVSEDGAGWQVSLHKSSASNVTDADVAVFSAWKQSQKPGGEATLEVFVGSARAPLVQESHVQRLAGFRTGMTGALFSTAPLPIDITDWQLGPDGAGVRALRLCFHLERLFIGALLAGILDGLLEECSEFLRQREEHDLQFCKNQYVQEKLTSIYTLARRTEGLLALVERALELGQKQGQPLALTLEAASALLGALKLTAVDDSLAATATAYELLGYAGYQRQSFVQKVHRDLLAFKMLGGSREQLKIALFRDLRELKNHPGGRAS